MSDLGERFVAQARSYLDVPFFHAGRSRQGLDCVGLLAVVAHDLGLTQFDDVNYQPGPDPEYLTAILSRFANRCWQRADREQPPRNEFGLRATGEYSFSEAVDHSQPGPSLLPGDLLQFNILGSAQHCGIYAENERGEGTVIHTYQSAGKVVEHLFDTHWRKNLCACYRWREG